MWNMLKIRITNELNALCAFLAITFVQNTCARVFTRCHCRTQHKWINLILNLFLHCIKTEDIRGQLKLDVNTECSVTVGHVCIDFAKKVASRCDYWLFGLASRMPSSGPDLTLIRQFMASTYDVMHKLNDFAPPFSEMTERWNVGNTDVKKSQIPDSVYQKPFIKNIRALSFRFIERDIVPSGRVSYESIRSNCLWIRWSEHPEVSWHWMSERKRS